MSTPGNDKLYSLKDAGKELGVSRLLVGELVKAHAIPTHQLPYCGPGKGLDASAMRRLRELLNRRKPSRREAKAAV